MKTFSEEVSLEGHIIDSWTLPRAFDTIMDMGGSFDVLEIQVGRAKDQGSHAQLKVMANWRRSWSPSCWSCRTFWCRAGLSRRCRLEAAPADGVLPEHFYSSTHLPTQVRLQGRWVEVQNTEMDLVIVINPERTVARMLPSMAVRKGELVVVGHDGIRVMPRSARVSARSSASWVATSVRSIPSVW